MFLDDIQNIFKKTSLLASGSPDLPWRLPHAMGAAVRSGGAPDSVRTGAQVATIGLQ